ncbi:MAG: N-6 DNA methylase, partial [Elusimicrobiota bacterium]
MSALSRKFLRRLRPPSRKKGKAADIDTLRAYLKQLKEHFATGGAREESYYPALKDLIETLNPAFLALSHPKRTKAGDPDFRIKERERTVGFIEAKDFGTDLSAQEDSEQMQRYRKNFSNLILTNFLEFRWYINGEPRLTVSLGSLGDDDRLAATSLENINKTLRLLCNFLEHSSPGATTPKELAVRLARLSHHIRDLVIKFYESEIEDGPVHKQLTALKQTLLPDLDCRQFADMYAQTIAYGLFMAKISSYEQTGKKSDLGALSKINPFLGHFFEHLADSGFDDRLASAIKDIKQVLKDAKIDAIIESFIKQAGTEDPTFHFYETFHKAYDPTLRELRGEYYTPIPAVSYIVRSVDWLIKNQLGKPKGLADHTVQILDPACGTGTFLYYVMRQIYDSLEPKAWNGYVSKSLLPRLFGFELLMAPYTLAHLKLGLFLHQTGYRLNKTGRLGIYLTNTLMEGAPSEPELPYSDWISEETNAAARIKEENPINVVLGN